MNKLKQFKPLLITFIAMGMIYYVTAYMVMR